MNDNYYTKELCRGFGLDYEEVIKINNSNPPRAYKFIGEGLLWYSRRDLALILLRYSIHVTELWSAVSQGDLTAYDEKGLTIINSFNVMGQNPPGCKYEQITIDNVWYFFYKGEDIKKFVENLRPSANQDVVVPAQQAPETQESPVGRVNERLAIAREFAKQVKKYHPELTRKEAAKQINLWMAEEYKAKSNIARGYSLKYLMKLIKKEFKPGKPGNPGGKPQK